MTKESSPSGFISISSSDATPLRRLLDETSDLIDSPPFSHVLTLLLDAGYSTLVDQKLAQQAYKIPATSDMADLDAPRITEVVDVKPVKLPIVLAILTRQAHSIGNGVPNEYLQSMEQVRDLEAFAAVVYSSNWENEIQPVDEDSGITLKDGPIDPAEVAGQESIVDVGSANAFESAWGKAVEDAPA
jgi:peroxin-3